MHAVGNVAACSIALAVAMGAATAGEVSSVGPEQEAWVVWPSDAVGRAAVVLGSGSGEDDVNLLCGFVMSLQLSAADSFGYVASSGLSGCRVVWCASVRPSVRPSIGRSVFL